MFTQYFLDEKVEEILDDLHLADAFFWDLRQALMPVFLEDEAASRAYLRGAFLSSGSIKDPEKGKYQLEIHFCLYRPRGRNCPSHERIFTRCENHRAEKRSGDLSATSGRYY